MRKLKYETLIKQMIDALGGKENIEYVFHCATRLRTKIKDSSILNKEKLESINGVLGVVEKGREIQCIIGTDVPSVYAEFVIYGGFNDQTSETDKLDNKEIHREDQTLGTKAKGLLSSTLDFISGTVLPVMPVFLAAGLVLALLNVLVNFFDMSTTSGTYTVLSSTASAGFFFLPVFIGFYAATKLGIPGAMGAFLGAVLVYEGINDVPGLSFLGLSIPQTAYNGSVLPVIVGVLILAIVYKALDKYLFKEIKYFLTPILSILIVVPITLLLIGPAGNTVSLALADFFTFLSSKVEWLSFAIYSAFNPILVLFGIDKAFVPIMLNNISTLGYDMFMLPAALTSNAAMGAAAIAVAFMSKKNDTKSTGYSAGITGILGITEPAIFGLLLPYRRALVGAMIGGAIGGIFAGILHIKQYAQLSPGVVALSTYITADGDMSNFYFATIALIIAVISSFLITCLLIKTDRKKQENQLFK